MSETHSWNDRLGWNVVVAVGAVALTCSFVGFSIDYPPGAGRTSGFVLPVLAGLLDNLWRSAALFVFEGDIDSTQNWLVVIGRTLAPFATIGGLFRLSADYAASRLRIRRLARMRHHMVIIGLGTRGRSLLASARTPVAVLDVTDSVPASRGRDVDVWSHVGDGRDLEALEQVGVPHARTVLILTGHDALNLEILDRVLALRRLADGELRVGVRLANRKLARQLDREDQFVRRGRGDGTPTVEDDARIEVEPFDEDRVGAQQLLQEHPLVDLADLRAQRRVHLVMIGWSGLTLEVMEQLARLSPYKQFDIPRVDLLVPDPDDVRAELAAVQPALVPAEHPAPDAVMDVRIDRLAHESGLPTPEQMRAVEPDGHAVVTAVVVALDTDDASAAAALSLRDRANVEGRWQCPIFVKAAITGTLTGLLEMRAELPDQADRIVPIGLLERTYRLENMFGDRQDAARKLHQAYLDGRRADGAIGQGPPDVDWPLLPQTYRIASRRAVDHLPIKLLSAGYRITGYPLSTAPDVDIVSDTDTLEALAGLEHRSWEIDRILSGWRSGPVRDDRRQVNEAIGIAYDELDERLGRPLRTYDREQVKVAARMLAREPGRITARRDLRLGLLGAACVADDERTSIVTKLERELPPLLADHTAESITLLTTLAPGAELILAEAVQRILDRSGCEHRLVIVRTLPRDVLIAARLARLGPGHRWSLHDSAADGRVDRARVAARLDELARAPQTAIANLLPVGCTMADWQDPEASADAQRRANAYVVSRSDLVVAVAGREADASERHVDEALHWVRGEAPIPAAYSRLLPGAAYEPPRTILIPGSLS